MKRHINGILRIGCMVLLAAFSDTASAQQWTNLLNGKDLSGWEVIGDGLWHLTSDGIVIGQRDPKQAKGQSWLYTKRDFGQFDLHVEYFNRFKGNSGVSIRDTSRAKEAHIPMGSRPSMVGYEIQLDVADTHNPTGSLYNVAAAKDPQENQFDWNSLDIESRNDIIRVRLNGKLVVESPGDPNRSKTGPIGLQLHDGGAFAMFRNLRIREVAK